MENYDIPNYEARKAALIEEITAAFDGVSRQGGVSMLEARVIDDYGSDEERAKARRQDNETRWQDVPDEKIGGGNGHEALSFLDPIGFHYYLPAYLVWYLRNVDSDWDHNTLSSVDFHLAAGYKKGEIEDYYRGKYEMLSLIQTRAVAHFLEFQAEREDWFAEINRQHYEEIHGAGSKPETISEADWDEIDRQTAEASYGSPEDKAELSRELKEFRRDSDSPDNDARYALEKYWGRFL